MFNLLKSDLYRLVRGKMLWVMTAIVVAMAAFVVAMMYWFSTPEFLYASARSMEFAVSSSDEVASAFEEAADEAAGYGLDPDDPDVRAAQQLLAMGSSADDLTAADFKEVSRDMRTVASPTEMLGDAAFSGGEVSLLTCLLVALFFASDFSTGFVRNLVMDRRGRVRYYGSKLVLVALVSLYFVLLTSLASAVAFAVGGFTYAAGNTVGEIASFLVLGWLIALAFGCLTAVVTWLTRSAGVGIAFAIVVGSSMAGALLGQVLLLVGRGMPWVASVQPWLLASGQNAMGGGMVSLMEGALPDAPTSVPAAVRIVVASGFWVAASAALTFGVLRKRDV